MNPNCPEAIITLVVQMVTGAFILALVGGLVIAKLLRPRQRSRTIMFSDKAVITRDEGELCFMFRVADLSSKTSLNEAHMRLYMAKKAKSQPESESPFKIIDMNVGFDNGFDRVFLAWPFTVRHVIDEKSPLYGITQKKLHNGKFGHFEIIAVLEGNVENTGMTAQARTSWLPTEIIWNHRLCEIIELDEHEEYKIQYSRFNQTFPSSSNIRKQTKSFRQDNSSFVDSTDYDYQV